MVSKANALPAMIKPSVMYPIASVLAKMIEIHNNEIHIKG